MNSNNNNIKFPLPCMLYDDLCPLCVRFKQTLEKIPGTKEISMVPLSNIEIFEIYPQLNKKNCKKELHILDCNQKVHKGSSAIEFLVNKFPMVSKFAWLIESEVGKKALNYFYQTANNYREKLKKRCEECN